MGPHRPTVAFMQLRLASMEKFGEVIVEAASPCAVGTRGSKHATFGAVIETADYDLVLESTTCISVEAVSPLRRTCYLMPGARWGKPPSSYSQSRMVVPLR